MTAWAWAQLAAGSYRLPGPALVTRPLVPRLGRGRGAAASPLSGILGSGGWVRTARKMVADCSYPLDLLVKTVAEG